MKRFNLRVVARTLSIALFFSSGLVAAFEDDDDDIPFDEAQLFFELNNTDGDLGIHGFVDGDEWKKLAIEDPNERRMLNIRISGRLKRQGLTELFFESAEPTFDELDPVDFFKRFPEGEYEIEGITLDGEERESEVMLSHVMPAPAENVQINGFDAAEDCDAELPVITSPVTLTWDPVISHHPDLGKSGDIEVDYYEVVLEIDESNYKSTIIVPPEINELTFPEAILNLTDEYKFEILVRSTNGNKTAMESCFEIE